MLPPDSPAIRIVTDPEAVESLVRDRQAWAALWAGIARETASAPTEEDRPDDEEAA